MNQTKTNQCVNESVSWSVRLSVDNFVNDAR